MQTPHVPDERTSDSAVAQPPLRVVLAYNDLSAGKRAMNVLASLAERLGGDVDFQPIPWSFNLLDNVDWRAVADSDAIKADMLILATTDPLPAAIGHWAETAIRNKTGNDAAVVALFGPDGNPYGAGSLRLQAIQAAAHQAGLAFFAPAARNELDQTLALIHRRAEFVTPLLDEILQQPDPRSRWGINE